MHSENIYLICEIFKELLDWFMWTSDKYLTSLAATYLEALL